MRFPDRSIRCRLLNTFMMLAAGNSHERSPPAKAPSSNKYPSLHGGYVSLQPLWWTLLSLQLKHIRSP